MTSQSLLAPANRTPTEFAYIALVTAAVSMELGIIVLFVIISGVASLEWLLPLDIPAYAISMLALGFALRSDEMPTRATVAAFAVLVSATAVYIGLWASVWQAGAALLLSAYSLILASLFLVPAVLARRAAATFLAGAITALSFSTLVNVVALNILAVPPLLLYLGGVLTALVALPRKEPRTLEAAG